MESSKCPKCGEEPQYLEHVEKWYCYGCNSYIDDEAEHVCGSENTKDECASAIEKELKSLDEEPSEVCRNCGAALEDLKDGKLYCFVCETYQEDVKQEPAKAPPNEAQALIESAAPHPAAVPVIEPPIPAPEPKPEVAPPETSPTKGPEAAPAKPVEIKACPTCGQPMKFIEKYQRNYCYGCRKYAPKAGVPAPEVHAKKEACPACGSELKFIEKYKEHYCYTCKKYPLRQTKRSVPEARAPAKPPAQTCHKCSGPLKLVEKYNRLYCYHCKEYAPKGAASPSTLEKKVCPACKQDMKFVKEYNEWYCYRCKKYSLRPNKPVLLL